MLLSHAGGLEGHPEGTRALQESSFRLGRRLCRRPRRKENMRGRLYLPRAPSIDSIIYERSRQPSKEIGFDLAVLDMDLAQRGFERVDHSWRAGDVEHAIQIIGNLIFNQLRADVAHLRIPGGWK